MARLLLLLVPLVICSTRSADSRGDMEGEQDDYYIYDDDERDTEVCGGPYDNGLNPDCEPCEAWCEANCDRTCSGDTACLNDGRCPEKCPCPLYEKKELNISVSCLTSQSVMDYDLSKLFNLSLDTSQLVVSVTIQVSNR